jgi:hypothetical protein
LFYVIGCSYHFKFIFNLLWFSWTHAFFYDVFI